MFTLRRCAVSLSTWSVYVYAREGTTVRNERVHGSLSLMAEAYRGRVDCTGPHDSIHDSQEAH